MSVDIEAQHIIEVKDDKSIVFSKAFMNVLAENLVQEFLRDDNKSALEKAEKLVGRNEVGKIIIGTLNAGWNFPTHMETVVKNFELVKRYLNVEEVKERITEKLSYLYREPGVLKEAFEKFEINSEKTRREIISKILDVSSTSTELKNIVNVFREYGDLFKKHSNVVVKSLIKASYWEWEEFNSGRGYFFEHIAETITKLGILKDYLSEEDLEKIQNVLLERIDTIKKIIKRRVKLQHHHYYLKAIISLLPEEYKKELVVYFL